MKQASLTSTIFRVMLILFFLSSGLAMFAVMNLAYSLGDAKAINASGSLRMQTYRLLYLTQEGQESRPALIEQFEQTLYSKELNHPLSLIVPPKLLEQYQLVIKEWHRIKHLIETQQSAKFTQAVPDFVDQINVFVSRMEQYAELKLKVLAASQIIGLSLMLLIAWVVVRYTKQQVVRPLQEMMRSAQTISNGDFNIEMPKTDYIELTALKDALQSTVHELDAVYRNLENQVAEKTKALSQAHSELTLLYDSLVDLHNHPDTKHVLVRVLKDLKQSQEIDGIRVQLIDDDYCEEIYPDQPWAETQQAEHQYPLTCNDTKFGLLQIHSGQNAPIKHHLYQNVAMMMARSLYIHHSHEEQQQLALAEERGIIARELHDSLGQLLSFLKIQISLLKRSLNKYDSDEQLQTQLQDINEGINTAYAQLRELLSTFRLTTKEANLRRALEVMLEQLKAQTEAKINFSYQLPGTLLGATQHIHILQLSREATLNAIKHAKAKNISINCYQRDDEQLCIDIADDGIGLKHLKERDQHFGISIMHERASNLAGHVEFFSNQEGGTTVRLIFPPQEKNYHE